jgi:regulatory protein
LGAPEWELDAEPGDQPEDGTEPGESAVERAARELDAALTHAYRLIARREHSVAELRTRLKRARLRPAAIEQALAIVTEQGYVDDERYARLLIEDRRAIDGWGVERIRARLEAAGIAGELTDELLGGFDTASELALAAELLSRRCALPLADERARQRAFGMLVQRGFEGEVAYDAIRAASRDGREPRAA